MTTQARIAETEAEPLLALLQAYERGRAEEAVDLFTEDAIFVGTGSDEVRFGREAIREQVRRDLAQADSVSLDLDDFRARSEAEATICYAFVTLNALVQGQTVRMPMRLTAVTRPDHDASRFSQVHFSLAADGQPAGDSFVRPGHAVVGLLRRAIESGDHSGLAEVYAADAPFEVNLPWGRHALVGPDAIAAQLDAWHPRAPRLVEWIERSADWGAVVELALWEGPNHRLYSRSLHRIEVQGERIARHVMYCLGDWDEETAAEQGVSR